MWRSHAAATKDNDGRNYTCIRKLKQIKAAVSAGGTKFLSASQDVSERASRYVSELASQHIFERVSISELASQCIFVVFLSLASQHISPLNIFQSSPFNTFQSSPLNIFLIAMYGASN